MNNYSEFLEERLDNMYGLVESSDIIMERLAKDERQVKRMSRRKFIAYLKTMHSDFNPEEITQAKTPAQRDRVIKKYENDYKKWKSEVRKDIMKDCAIDFAVFTLIDLLF